MVVSLSSYYTTLLKTKNNIGSLSLIHSHTSRQPFKNCKVPVSAHLMTYQYQIKRLYKWCLIFQQGVEGGNWFSDTKHIDQSLICFDGWESRASCWGKPCRSSKEGADREGDLWKSIEQFAETHQWSFPEISYVEDALDRQVRGTYTVAMQANRQIVNLLTDKLLMVKQGFVLKNIHCQLFPKDICLQI